MIDTMRFRQNSWITMTSKFWMLSSINKKIIVRTLSFQTLYCNMIKAILFLIMSRSRSWYLRRLMHWHFWISTTIRWRIEIYSLSYATMFFSCFSNSWFQRSLTSFCRANSSCCCFLRFALMSRMIREAFLILNLRRSFFSSKRSFFIHEKAFLIRWTLRQRTWKFRESFAIFLRDTISFWCDVSNRSSFFLLFSLYNSRLTRCARDFHMRRIFCACQWCWNRNRSCDVLSRTCRIQQQFCSVYRYDCISDNWSIVVRCNFWWIAHISSFQKLSTILRTVINSSFSRWRSRYEESNISFFFVWFFAIRSSFWWSSSSVNAHWFSTDTLWNSSDYFYRCVQSLSRWLARRKFDCESWSRRLFYESFLIASVKRF